jgi:hypothetical protein
MNDAVPSDTSGRVANPATTSRRFIIEISLSVVAFSERKADPYGSPGTNS